MNDINPFDLLSIKMCSPMIIFIIFVIVSAISLFMSRNTLKRYGSHKVDNLYNLHSWSEIKLILVFGVVLYGLCQYNQTTLAWIYLALPVLYLIVKNLIVYYNISLAQQNAPHEREKVETDLLKQFTKPNNNVIEQQKVQMSNFKESEPERMSEQYPKVNKDINFSGNLAGVSTQPTQVLGSSIDDLRDSGSLGGGFQDLQGYNL